MTGTLYRVEYLEEQYSEQKYILIKARNKEEAYEKGMDALGWRVYAAWVSGAQYRNGTTRFFNTFAGKPY